MGTGENSNAATRRRKLRYSFPARFGGSVASRMFAEVQLSIALRRPKT
jgi:hypothetical protein